MDDKEGSMKAAGAIAGRKLVDTERYKYHILVACFFAFMFDNADMLVTSIGLPLLLEAFDISVVEGGLIATVMLIGAAVGAWFWGPLADRIGRKRAYIVCLSWYTVFTFACGFCNTLTPFLALRFCCGLALGGAWTIGVAYLSDFFPERQRGRAVCAVQSSAAVGMLLVTIIMRMLVPVFTWRALFFSSLLAIPLIIYFCWLPESPTWLKARYGARSNAEAYSISSATLPALFKIRECRRALLLCAIIVIGVQVGSWGAGSWIPTFLTSERGLSVEAMTNVVAAMYIGGFAGYWVLGYMADKIGRKRTYIFISFYTTLAIVAYMLLADDRTVWLFAGLFGFGSYGMFGPLGALVSESIPMEARGRGLGFVWGAGRLVAALVPVVFGGLSTVTSLQFCILLTSVFYFLCFIASCLLREPRGEAAFTGSSGEAGA